MRFSENPNQIGWPLALHKPVEAGPLASSSTATNSSSSSARPLKQQYYGNKFHRAALDGYVDMLCEASRHDTNLAARDHHLQLTPTLVAAQCGQLEALRMLVGRGGDPERVTSLGSTALHLAAARNNLNCVSFLVNFGVNMWALDNELHTAKDVAAVEQSKEVLEYLDQMMARQSAINTKLVQKLKEKAKNAAEKRLKRMRKLQLKAIKQIERDERLLAKMSQNRRPLKAAHSMSDIKLVGRSCSDMCKVSVNLLPDQCDNSVGESQKGSSTSSCSSQSIANFIQQRLQQDLLAKSRRARHQQQCDIMAASSRSSSSQETNSTVNSSYRSSSVSSTSGYLSSCSAQSILKSAAPANATKRPGLLGAGSAPKYSDLVAVKREELREVERKSRNTDNRFRQQAKDAHKSSFSSGSMIASKLRAIGGVSRKVHLKRLLFATSKQTGESAQQDEQSEKSHRRASAMKRARSEPDFGAALRQNQATGDENEDHESDCDNEQRETTRRAACEYPNQAANCHSDKRATNASENNLGALYMMTAPPPPRPPPPPPPAVAFASQEDQQQVLLTQCLSQLKLQQQQQHEESSGCHSFGALQQAHPFGHSHELLLHQQSAGEFPLRPSIIKHRQQQRRRSLSTDNSHKSLKRPPPVSALDSIGSVGSFVARNAPETNAILQGPLAAPHQSPSQTVADATSNNCPHRPSRLSVSSSSSSSASDPIQCDSASSMSASSPDPNNNATGVRPLQDAKLADFLAQNKLTDLADVLARERIDFEALMLLDESDLKSINLLLGPRRKLLNAVKRLTSAREEQQADDTEARARAQKLCMVDTQF